MLLSACPGSRLSAPLNFDLFGQSRENCQRRLFMLVFISNGKCDRMLMLSVTRQGRECDECVVSNVQYWWQLQLD